MSTAPEAVGLDSRRVAWRALQAVAAGAYADLALERELQRLPLSPPDRALATELCFGAIRQRRRLDAWLDQLGRVPADRQPPRLRWLLHLGLYQLLATERVPASAAVSTTVELAKLDGLARLAPVVNGLLRAFLRRPQADLPLPLPAGVDPAAAAFGLRHSLPDWLAAELLGWLPPDQAEAFALAANQPPPLDLRVNPLRASRDAVLAAFSAAGQLAEPLEETPWGLTLLGRCGDLRSLPGYSEGHWCVQDRAAQTIAPLLDPRPGERLLDACAAPGGKSTHLAELIGDQGTVVAVDRSAGRLRRVRANADRLGLSSIQLRQADAAELTADPVAGAAAEERFDRILLDAPCSGLGTLARHADARWRIEPATIDELVVLQRRLLEGMVPLLKPAGRLVYATCTVHPAENGELIRAFLAGRPGWSQLAERQLWPRPGGGDGFYAAVLQAPG
ncbi:16S rRNA (cytosine(967)-C(5))-methyltransferase [Synechococcus sp. CS-1325]|uniref:16S rRNA (cytosine(967)-C(5))-methyltransferase n=1 Tax=unclassified Synechococcus TaxID=2626047 RepID=UPI0021A7F0D8|nr:MULTISPECIES: 16S rRNA (cytosine(967)-C(5))-methyltransferase [unclassified Synechococcus]MCT0200778.1 16S rRNA (cytosine(967)-C(5))-methyltransferase [Synechococcus sp. CS-1325]MCT0230553.1 16S rRNA (cytosine(967)-C(5))-methyltransferase [Synechococcus sp. CS-1324]